MRELEHAEAVNLMDWVTKQENVYPELSMLFHVPNGGHQNIVVAVKLKKEGVKPGIPDYVLPVPRNEYHGLFIELKAENGRVTDEQKQWHKDLRQYGYDVRVCFGWEACVQALKDYLGVRR